MRRNDAKEKEAEAWIAKLYAAMRSRGWKWRMLTKDDVLSGRTVHCAVLCKQTLFRHYEVQYDKEADIVRVSSYNTGKTITPNLADFLGYTDVGAALAKNALAKYPLETIPTL